MVIVGYLDVNNIAAQGATREEVVAECLRRAEAQIVLYAQLWEGVCIPFSMVEKIPRETPTGMTLIIMERCSHSHGEAYDWKFLSMKPGEHEPAYGITIGTDPILVSTMDSNSEAIFELPEGTLEYKDGQWQPCKDVRYGY